MKISRGGPSPLAVGLLALAIATGCGQPTHTPGAPAAGTHGNGARPVLVIASFFPLTVRGRHFRPRTEVTLRAQPDEAGLRPVYARIHVGRDGIFGVRLHGYGLDPCTGVTVSATTPGQARVSISSHPRGCPPVPVPSPTAP